MKIFQKILPTLLFAGVTVASFQTDASIIPGIETSQLDPDLQGRALIEEMNCVACHQSESLAVSSRKSPRLTDVGSRVNPNYLKSFIAAPHEVKSGTLMPDLLGCMDATERKEVAESITHYLVSLNERDTEFHLEAPDAVAAELGERLFHSVGCVACHSPRDAEAQEIFKDKSVPLGDLEQKYSQKSLVEFLQRPHSVRPSGRMPDLRLPRQEIERIAHYLLQKTTVPGNLAYMTWRGKVWEGLEGDVEKERAGMVNDFSLESFEKNVVHHHTVVRYTGYLQIQDAGDYTFHIEMNGGSLALNGKEVVSVKPSDQRGVQKRQATANLSEGWNRIEMTYFHTGYGPRFSLEMEGPGFERKAIPSSMLSFSDQPIQQLEPLQPDPELVLKGKKHFETLGCAQCHDDVQTSQKDYLAMAKLDPSKGCLAGSTGAPSFQLSDKQVSLIASALPHVQEDDFTAEQMVNRTLTTFNCIACHDREGLGGIADERKVYFNGSEELGDQGSFPPTLTDVGAKLTQDWLSQILIHGGRQRYYLNTRMPLFGEANVAPLVTLLGKVDENALEKAPIPKVVNVEELKEAGHKLMGAEGLSCIACHDFNGQKSGGVGALELVNVTERLQKNWFHLYMRQPSRFHPTVIMPSYWPGGESIRKEILGGDTEKQIESLWVYLSDGIRAKNPIGLSRQSPELRVTTETMICRGRSSIGYRGIAVGYPERISLAFNSEEMTLRQLWKGEFANVDHGRFNPRGSDRINFEPGIPFHRLASLDDSWPYKGKTNYEFPQDHGYQFRGYFLDKLKRPTLMYHYGDIAVKDFFEDLLDSNGEAYFKRTITFETSVAQDSFYFRAATGQKITQSDKGWQVDNLNLRLTGDPTGIIRQGEIQDLLIPIQLPTGKTIIQLEYRW